MGRLPSQLKSLPEGLREYTNEIRDRLMSGDLNRESEEMAAIKEELQKNTHVCGAIMKNKVCTTKPVNEKNLRCGWHGGKSTGAKTEEGKEKMKENLEKGRAPIHGLYQKDFLANLTEDEKNWYSDNLEWYKENYDLDPLDITKLDLALINFIKSWRKNGTSMKYAVNEKVSMVDFENRAVKLLDDLGLSRKFRKSKENAGNPSNVNIYNQLFDN